MPRKIPQELKEKIYKDAENGYTYTNIGRNYGMPPNTVKNILAAKNRERLLLPEAEHMSREEKIQAIKERLEKTDDKQNTIAGEYGVHDAFVSLIAKRYKLRQWKEQAEMSYTNPEGYADPTPHRAMNPNIIPGEVWEADRQVEGTKKTLLILQVFDTHAICLCLLENGDRIDEQHLERLIIKGTPFLDCGKPQFVFLNKLTKRIGQITISRLCDIRKKVSDIILKGYPDEEPALATQDAPRSDSKPELDKIPTEEEKPQETAGNTLEQEDAIRAVLQYKAASLEALTNRLLDIVERAVQKGA